VSNVINSVNVSKATGPDDIGNSFIKQLFPPLSNEICIFFNYCITHGVFPAQWKKSNVIPVYKKGDTSHVNNYRPISLRSCLSMVLNVLSQMN
jgi:hypothetical protein